MEEIWRCVMIVVAHLNGRKEVQERKIRVNLRAVPAHKSALGYRALGITCSTGSLRRWILSLSACFSFSGRE